MKQKIINFINSLSFFGLLMCLLNSEEILNPQLSDLFKFEILLLIIISLINIGKSIMQANDKDDDETNYLLFGKRK